MNKDDCHCMDTGINTTDYEIVCYSCGSSFMEPHGDRWMSPEHGKPKQHERLWYCCWCGKITHGPYFPLPGEEEDSERGHEDVIQFESGRFKGMTITEVVEMENGMRYLEAMAKSNSRVAAFLKK